MKVARIRPEEDKGHCHDCHSRAVFEVDFGELRPRLRLCLRDGKYLVEFMGRRIAEHEAGKPIPVPRQRDDQPRSER